MFNFSIFDTCNNHFILKIAAVFYSLTLKVLTHALTVGDKVQKSSITYIHHILEWHSSMSQCTWWQANQTSFSDTAILWGYTYQIVHLYTWNLLLHSSIVQGLSFLHLLIQCYRTYLTLWLWHYDIMTIRLINITLW